MRKINLSEGLNNEQYKAVSIIEGPLLVIAGAGSGKTRMLTYRIANMLSQGIDESNILALTFTNKAAKEMGQRVRELTVCPLKKLTTTTFHSFGMGVLKQFIQLLGYKNDFTIYDTDDKLALIRKMIEDNDENPGKYDFYELASLFSDIKTKRTVMDPDSASKISRYYQEYNKLLKAYNAVDFDDLITLPLYLFAKNPEILGKLRDRFKYILVDEFQDTSLCQYKLVSCLAVTSRNLCVVGDDDQSIYSWRGANYQNLMMFEKDFPERVEIKLEKNYRSSGTILEAANDLIVHNKQRKSKKLWTDKDKGSSIRIIHPLNASFESNSFADTIEAQIQENHSLTYDDFAILVRTNRLLQNIGDVLEERNIPVDVTGGPNLLDRKEIRDILSYLKLIVNLDDDVNLLRVINTPSRGIGRVTLEKIRTVSDNFGCSLFDAAKRMSLTEDTSVSEYTKKALKRFIDMITDYDERLTNSTHKSEVLRLLVKEIDYKGYLVAQHPDNENLVNYQMKGIDIFCKKLAYFEQKNPGHPVSQFINRISLDSKDEDEEAMGTVKLMTMHAAKGLEFHTVFLAAVEEPYIPSGKALEENSENIEEERRLFYVAITRAKVDLVISTCINRERNGKEMVCVPSRFLSEIPKSLFDEDDPNRKVGKNEAIDRLAAFREKLARMSEQKK